MTHRASWLTAVTVVIVTLIPGGLSPCRGQHIGAAEIDTSLPVVPDGVVSRAITWENRTGEVGAGGQAASGLGKGRKGSPCIGRVKNGETTTLMDVEGCGV
ncbi:MAG: hypothetical protein GY778_03375, partial [bacterium]|nr:hypothetical protein [bacterium]